LKLRTSLSQDGDHPFQFRSSCLGALRGDSLLFRLKVSRHFTPLLGEMAIRALRLKIRSLRLLRAHTAPLFDDIPAPDWPSLNP
jgi:hypothetical protein